MSAWTPSSIREWSSEKRNDSLRRPKIRRQLKKTFNINHCGPLAPFFVYFSAPNVATLQQINRMYEQFDKSVSKWTRKSRGVNNKQQIAGYRRTRINTFQSQTREYQSWIMFMTMIFELNLFSIILGCTRFYCSLARVASNWHLDASCVSCLMSMRLATGEWKGQILWCTRKISSNI